VDETFLTDVETQEIEIAGRRVRFPVRYYEATTMGATFVAPLDRVQRVLPSSKLVPIQPAPGMALVYLGAYSYRRIEGLAPYNEFGVMAPCTYKESTGAPSLPGSFFYHLPVTTEEARLGGVEIYGFPKFVAEIEFEDGEQTCHCRVSEGGREIVSLQVNKVPTVPETSESYCYTVKDGQLVRTRVQSQGEAGASEVGGGALFFLGEHPVAEQIGALAMRDTSVGHRYAPQVQMLLHAPGAWLSL
jgi:hypothetical protein